MNRMKHLLAGFLLTIPFALSVSAQALVSLSEQGEATLLVSEATLLQHLSHYLVREAGLEADFTDLEIMQEAGQVTLLATGDRYRTALALEPSDSGAGIFRASGLSCTTDCGSEPDVCMPNTSNSTCVPACETGTCSRTVSVGTTLLDY